MTSTPNGSGQLSIAIIGAGRAGTPIAAALAGAGHRVAGVVARSEAAKTRVVDMLGPDTPVVSVAQAAVCPLVLIAVPDREIASVAAELAEHVMPHTVVVHVSGAHGTGVLADVAAAGAMTGAMHPAMTFSGTSLDVRDMVGCAWAVTATPVLAPLLGVLIESTGGRAFDVPEQMRPLYHAALCHGANHAVTLIAQSLELLREAGIDDPAAVLGPLVTASVRGALDRGDDALTGPVSRADTPTVAAHRRVLAERAVAPTYDALVEATAARACASGRITAEQATQMLGLVRSEPDHEGGLDSQA